MIEVPVAVTTGLLLMSSCGLDIQVQPVDHLSYGANIAEVAVLAVANPGAYRPDPGHPASGVLVAIVH